MRIQVVFNDTPVLVPCGDGKLTVGELIDKAIVRYKKLVQNKQQQAQHPDDVITVRGLRMLDGGSFIDRDDEVAEVLEDKEAVLLDFEYTPHYAAAGAGTFSSDPQPYDFLPASTGIDTSQEDHTEEGLSSSPHDPAPHIVPGGEASQDTELVTSHSWHDSQSSVEQSPPLTRHNKTPPPPRWSTSSAAPAVNTSAGMILESQDSGYAPNKSQESYGHSQPKSQEGYSSVGSELVFQNTSQTRNDFSPNSTKTDFQSTTSAKNEFPSTKSDYLSAPGSKPKAEEEAKPALLRERAESSRYAHRSRDKFEAFPLTPPRSRDSYMFSSLREPPPALRGYPYSDTSRGSSLPQHHAPQGAGFEDSFERSSRYPMDQQQQQQRWHYHDPGGYHPAPPPPHSREDMPPHYWGSGRFTRTPDSSHFPPMTARRSDRFSLAVPRTLSHERVDQPYGLPGRPTRSSEDDPTLDYFLSQPSPSYFSYERPPGFPPGAAMMSYEQSRLAMAGPSGHSLSQPGMMMAHAPRGGVAPFSDGRLGGSNLKMRGRTDSLERRSDRALSLEDEFSRLEEEDEEMFGEGGGKGARHKPSPFRRDFRKSMFRDGPLYAQWMERIEEYGIQDGDIGLPEFEGDTSQSQRTPSPKPAEEERKKPEDSEDEDDFGNIHILELHKGEEPIGLELVPCTSPQGQDLGVFIGELRENGFAAKSGKVQICDRLLACNGVDFTKESNARVVELFERMSAEPLLRMAVSRGLQPLPLPAPPPEDSQGEPAATPEQQQQQQQQPAPSEPSPAPSKKIASSLTQAPSTTLTNTRQIGIKHTITLSKGASGFGFGVSSRDVLTDDRSQPIYVKSITSGGAAFADGRLKIGDRLLSVDGVEVTGMRQSEVVALLRQASGQVRVVVSRQGTVTEEVELAGESGTGAAGKSMVVLDIPLYNSGAAGLGVTVCGKSSQNAAEGDMGIYIKSIVPGGAAAMDGGLRKSDQLLSVGTKSLVGRSNQEALEVLRQALAGAGSGEAARVRLVVARRTSGGGGTPSMAALGEEPEEDEPDGSAGREVGIDVPQEQPPQATPTVTETTATLMRSEDALGSGEFDRLEPLVPSSSSQEVVGVASPASSQPSSTQSSSLSEQLFSWYDAAAASVHTGCQPPGGEYSSLDRKGMSRSMSQPSNFAMAPPPMTTPPTSRHGYPPSGSVPHPQMGRHSNREPSPYDHGGRYQSFSPYSDTGSLPPSGPALDSSQLPTRGSGRRDRNRPERGSSRAHSSHSAVTSPEAVFSTLPRTGSRGSERSPAAVADPETASLCSLENLRLTDSESNEAFRRDNPGRISITKKTKKNPRQGDLAHFQYANVEPLVEGEAGPVLVRTGSDGCLNERRSGESELLRGLELGPQLGMVKSSSLESLHNVMQHTIKRDVVDDGSELRSRRTRSSFRRAVDRSLEDSQQEEEQRGVDVPYELEGSATVPALVSYTKSPHGKKNNKTGFLKKVFKKRKRKGEGKESPKVSRKHRGSSLGASLDSSYDHQLTQRYTLPLRQGSVPGSGPAPTGGDGGAGQAFRPYSMSAVEGYESPSSPDDQLLSTLARV